MCRVQAEILWLWPVYVRGRLPLSEHGGRRTHPRVIAEARSGAAVSVERFLGKPRTRPDASRPRAPPPPLLVPYPLSLLTAFSLHQP